MKKKKDNGLSGLINEHNMKFIRVNVVIMTTLFSFNALAGVYKCTDEQGNTSYQSMACAEEKKALKIDMKTGGATDISRELKVAQEKMVAEIALKKQEQEEKKAKEEAEAKWLKESAEQSALNQKLIKDNPIQFSAFAIPPYLPNKVSALVKLYEARLPEIEKFRRFAAQTALKTGECIRVESDQLSVKSKPGKLVFSVDCSSAKTFYYTEAELANQ